MARVAALRNDKSVFFMESNPLHQEENFWPSVSDMFLSFFVIALALAAIYHNTHEKEGESLDYAYQQRTDMVLRLVGLDNEHYDSREDEQDKATRPAMAKLLCEALEKIEADEQHRTASGKWLVGGTDALMEARARDDYTEALRYMGQRLGRSYGARASGFEMLEDVAEQIQLLKMRDTGDQRTPDELKAEVEKLRHLLAAKVREIEELMRRLSMSESELRQEIAELSRRLAEKQRELDELRDKLEEASRRLEVAQGVIAGQRNEIDALSKDNRRDLMAAVRKMLAEYGIPVASEENQMHGLIVDDKKAVLRIPSTVVYFGSGSAIPQTQGEFSDILEKISKLLRTVAEANADPNSSWGIYGMVDNIVIESHCDSKPFEAEVDGYDMDGNEVLSSNRSLVVWDLLNGKDKRLEGFRNLRDEGLFSHAGFGSRVPLPDVKGEPKEEYHMRCRRIDIRFNCAPEAERQQRLRK